MYLMKCILSLKEMIQYMKNFYARREYSCAVNETLAQFDDSYHFVFMPQGLGDILFFCLFAKAYRARMAGKKIVMIVTKPAFESLVKLYWERFDVILNLDPRLFITKCTTRFTYFYPRIYDTIHPQPTLLDAVRVAMDLPSECDREIPEVKGVKFHPEFLLKIQQKKCVLISTDATSCSTLISDGQWIQVAKTCEKAGYYVFFNINNPMRFSEFDHVFLSIEETIQFCNTISLFIGYRSGLCDVISAFCKCRQIIVYPNNRRPGEFDCIKDYDLNPNQKYMEYCSLKTMFPQADVHEFLYEQDSFIMQMEAEIHG